MAWLTPEQAVAASRNGGGAGVRIAVLDTGADLQNPVLAKAKIADAYAITSRSGVVQVAEGAEDTRGHGTAVLGMLLDRLPAAEFGIFNILGTAAGGGAEVTLRAVQMAAERGYNVVHCSFGAPATGRDVMLYKGWVDALYLRGIAVVAAGSNSGFCSPTWPASFASVFAVGADPTESEELSVQSGSMTQFAISGRVENALWLDGQRRRVIGSSFAAPKVTARVRAAYPDVAPSVIKAALLDGLREKA